LVSHQPFVASAATCAENAMISPSMLMEPMFQAFLQVHFHQEHLMQQSLFSMEDVLAEVHPAVPEVALMVVMVMVVMPVACSRRDDVFQFADHRLEFLLLGPEHTEAAFLAGCARTLLQPPRTLSPSRLFTLDRPSQEHRSPKEER
jgi:hypothetical protein